MRIPLSVLDLSPVVAGETVRDALRNTIDLAQWADELGYTRYWLAEHHNTTSVASTTPELLIGQIARETTRIRVGSGGVMLPNHTPLKVAETFRLLEALYPDRIDLGIGRAPGTDQLTALALRRSREALAANDFPEQLQELQAFATGHFPDNHPYRAITAGDPAIGFPPIFLLGSSDFSARFAAAMGLGFAFAHQINPTLAVPVTRLYRQQFEPSAQLQKPYAILTVAAICAETDARAHELAQPMGLAMLNLFSGRPSPLPTVETAAAYPYTPAERAQVQAILGQHLIGSPQTVHARLTALVESTGADEVMLLTHVHDHADRRRSYQLIAEAFGLTEGRGEEVGAAV